MKTDGKVVIQEKDTKKKFINYLFLYGFNHLPDPWIDVDLQMYS